MRLTTVSARAGVKAAKHITPANKASCIPFMVAANLFLLELIPGRKQARVDPRTADQIQLVSG
jgi:hypothetical protein